MTNDEQLKQWVLGNSIHNKTINECCPDFSCCNKKINTPKKVRERFARAVKYDDHRTVNEMLGMFLGQAAQSLGKNIYIAGLQPSLETH